MLQDHTEGSFLKVGKATRSQQDSLLSWHLRLMRQPGSCPPHLYLSLQVYSVERGLHLHQAFSILWEGETGQGQGTL